MCLIGHVLSPSVQKVAELGTFKPPAIMLPPDPTRHCSHKTWPDPTRCWIMFSDSQRVHGRPWVFAGEHFHLCWFLYSRKLLE